MYPAGLGVALAVIFSNIFMLLLPVKFYRKSFMTLFSALRSCPSVVPET